MAKTVLAEVKVLARHLPLLGGAMGVVALSMVSIAMAENLVRKFVGNGGDVRALVAEQVEILTAVSVKVTAWGEQVLAFFGGL